jgi:hypothetical protein
MSGQGLVSVRLPESMLQRVRLTARRRGLTTNEFARSVVGGLVGLAGAQIQEIPEPGSEGTNPRLSLYLGDEGLQVLNSAATASGLSPSSVLRRALNAALGTKLMSPVQHSEHDDHSLSWLPILIAIVAAIVVPVLNAIAQARTASVQQKGAS